jgi:hypothetical protein
LIEVGRNVSSHASGISTQPYDPGASSFLHNTRARDQTPETTGGTFRTVRARTRGWVLLQV